MVYVKIITRLIFDSIQCFFFAMEHKMCTSTIFDEASVNDILLAMNLFAMKYILRGIGGYGWLIV